MPAGRPTKYKQECVEQGYRLAREGFTDRNIAKILLISESTLNLWKLEHPEFSESLKKGKDEFDSAEVEYCLLKRACGYKYTETTKEIAPVVSLKTGKPFLRITKKVIKEVAPDVTAQIFWLKNRQPERWRDKSEMYHGGVVKLISEPMKKPKTAGT